MTDAECNDFLDQLLAEAAQYALVVEVKAEAAQPEEALKVKNANVAHHMLAYWGARPCCDFVGNGGKLCQKKLKGEGQIRCSAHTTAYSFVPCPADGCEKWHRGNVRFQLCNTHSAPLFAQEREVKRKAAVAARKGKKEFADYAATVEREKAAHAEKVREFEERHANTKQARSDAKKAAAIEARSQAWPQY